MATDKNQAQDKLVDIQESSIGDIIIIEIILFIIILVTARIYQQLWTLHYKKFRENFWENLKDTIQWIKGR